MSRNSVTNETNYEYEHLAIDNLSTDSTVNILEKLMKTDKNLKAIVNSEISVTLDLLFMGYYKPMVKR